MNYKVHVNIKFYGSMGVFFITIILFSFIHVHYKACSCLAHSTRTITKCIIYVTLYFKCEVRTGIAFFTPNKCILSRNNKTNNKKSKKQNLCRLLIYLKCIHRCIMSIVYIHNYLFTMRLHSTIR